MVDANLVAAVVFGGCILGAFGRAMFPYLRKLKEEEDVEAETAKGMIREKAVKFQRKYMYSAIFSVVVSLFVGMTLFPTLVDNAINSQVQEIAITNGTASTDTVPVTDADDAPGVSGTTGLAGIFFSAFLTAWGMNSITNNIMATGKATSENIIPGSFMKPQKEGATTTSDNYNHSQAKRIIF